MNARDGLGAEMRRETSLRIGVHHAIAVVWGPVCRTRLYLVAALGAGDGSTDVDRTRADDVSDARLGRDAVALVALDLRLGWGRGGGGSEANEATTDAAGAEGTERGVGGERRRQKFLRIGVHHANAVVWGPVRGTGRRVESNRTRTNE